MQILTIVEKSRNAKQVIANIVSSPSAPDFVYHTGYLTLASCAVPEFVGDCLYIWGTETTRNNEDVEINIEDWPKVLCAVAEFNAVHNSGNISDTIRGYHFCCNHYWLNPNDCYCQRKACHICNKEQNVEVMRPVIHNGVTRHICKDHKKTKVCPICGEKDYFLFNHKKHPIEVCFSCSTIELPWGEQKNYSFKPEPIFYDYSIKEKKIINHTYGTINKTPKLNVKFWMGHEVEQQYDEKCPREIVIGGMNKELGEILYCKADSSIGHNGTEAVTHPFSWDYYKHVGLKGILSKQLVDWRKSTQQVGHHVHVNNTAFSRLHLYRFLRFHHTHLNWVEFISQRKLAHYCKTTGGSLTKAYNKRGRDRYEFINLSNGKTIEWRAFASPTSYEEFCKNTEYLYAAYVWTKENSNTELKSVLLEEFIMKHTKLFPNLIHFINENKDKTSLAKERHIINREENYDSMGKNRLSPRLTPRLTLDSTRQEEIISTPCSICGTVPALLTAYETTSGNRLSICAHCEDDHTFYCNSCNELIVGTYEYDEDDEQICLHCARS